MNPSWKCQEYWTYQNDFDLKIYLPVFTDQQIVVILYIGHWCEVGSLKKDTKCCHKCYWVGHTDQVSSQKCVRPIDVTRSHRYHVSVELFWNVTLGLLTFSYGHWSICFQGYSEMSTNLALLIFKPHILLKHCKKY